MYIIVYLFQKWLFWFHLQYCQDEEQLNKLLQEIIYNVL